MNNMYVTVTRNIDITAVSCRIPDSLGNSNSPLSLLEIGVRNLWFINTTRTDSLFIRFIVITYHRKLSFIQVCQSHNDCYTKISHNDHHDSQIESNRSTVHQSRRTTLPKHIIIRSNCEFSSFNDIHHCELYLVILFDSTSLFSKRWR